MNQNAMNPLYFGRDKKKLFTGLSIGLVGALFVSLIGTPYMGVATFSYFTLLTGLSLRKSNPPLHGKLMTTGIAIDLLLVLILEFQRSAIATAVEFSLSPLQQAHVIASSMATVLYFPVLIIGFKLMRAFQGKIKVSPSLRKSHVKIGVLTILFRSLGFILMFSMIGRN